MTYFRTRARRFDVRGGLVRSRCAARLRAARLDKRAMRSCLKEPTAEWKTNVREGKAIKESTAARAAVVGICIGTPASPLRALNYLGASSPARKRIILKGLLNATENFRVQGAGLRSKWKHDRARLFRFSAKKQQILPAMLQQQERRRGKEKGGHELEIGYGALDCTWDIVDKIPR
ncbi:hypothetical protein BKA80DRAFT_276501 [Phyllosticta citrichinensis]